MLCNNCRKKQATHYLENYNSQGEDLYLCHDCYLKLRESDFFGPDFLATFFMQEQPSEELRCPVCKTSFSDYKQTGIVGCERCYQTFKEELLPTIRKIHGKITHMGKHPQGETSYYELIKERNRLRSELELAIKEKRMQDADKINKDIKEINRIIYQGDFGGKDD